jgi:hypothetical protein
MTEYCSIRGEGFTETCNFGFGRTLYRYSVEDNNTFTEELSGCKYPDNYDLEEIGDGETKEFGSQEQLMKHIISVIISMSRDNYYSEIYISFPKDYEDKNLIDMLNLQQPLDRQPDCCYTFRNDDAYIYYLYPKHTIIKTKKCKTSKKEESFIDTCKKILPDLETQIMFEIGDKHYCVDGFCEEKNIIIEFLGDYYHGNPEIYNSSVYNEKLKKTAGELYNEWEIRRNSFESLNYKVVYLWETDYDKMTKKDIINWLTLKM